LSGSNSHVNGKESPAVYFREMSETKKENGMKRKLLFLVVLAMVVSISGTAVASEILTCWFPPSWKAKGENAKIITKALTKESGIIIRPRIARDYPEILTAFASPKPSLVYVGSFVQAVIKARGLGTPLVQAVNGKEFYSGIMIYPKGKNPEEILKKFPKQISFAAAASSSESSAKAATHGQADIKVGSHSAALDAVEEGRAKAAFVKNWWWEANKPNYPSLESYEIQGISVIKNPDNVLTASKSVSADVMAKITKAALAQKDAFGASKMVRFNKSELDFTLDLMKRAGINPITYSW
jgi:ABC-type phosphate/phosphonate transport system substrate-binding protein